MTKKLSIVHIQKGILLEKSRFEDDYVHELVVM